MVQTSINLSVEHLLAATSPAKFFLRRRQQMITRAMRIAVKQVFMNRLSKILFVEPPRNSWFIMGEYLPPPTGLLVLAAYVQKEIPDIEVEVLDCQAERRNWESLRKAIESSAPSVVATSGFTANAFTCARTAEIAKNLDSQIVTVVGGRRFIFMDEESLASCP